MRDRYGYSLITEQKAIKVLVGYNWPGATFNSFASGYGRC